MIKRFFTSILTIISLSVLVSIPSIVLAKSDNANNAHGRPEAIPSTVSASTSPSAAPSPEDLNRGHKDWKEKYNEYKSAGNTQRLDALKELAFTLIENRLTFLANLKTEITNNSNISEETRQSLLNDLAQNVSDLGELKTQIASETDLNTLKDLVRSIYTKFQIYSVVGPSDLGQGISSQGQYILGRLEAIQRQLQTIINQNKNAGKDLSSVQSLMDQLTAKLAEAKTQLAISESKFKSMTPGNTNEAKRLRDEGKVAFRTAKQALKDAHDILKQIVAQLKTLSASPKASPSTSVTPTTSPTVTTSISPSPTTTVSTSPEASPSITPSTSAIPTP